MRLPLQRHPLTTRRRTVATAWLVAAAVTVGAGVAPAVQADQPDPTGAPPPADSVPTDGQTPYLDDSGRYSFEERAADLVSRMTLDEKLQQFRATTSEPAQAAIPRLGVEGYRYWNEALHGVARVGEATTFPTGLGIGATWDRDLVRDMADAVSSEARALWNDPSRNLGLTYWSPTINMARDPRWGRAEENYGEDPFLTGQLAGEFVDGMQGDDDTYLKTVATVKHFAANNHENDRHSDSADVDEKTLREYYLPAFQETVENHGVGSLMTAYNAVNGVPMPANERLVTDVLRRTWGFDGFVTSDCGAVDDVFAKHRWQPEGSDHPVTAAEAAAFTLRAGTDIDCKGGFFTAHLPEALEQGLISEGDLDLALTRLFTTRMRTGEFDAHDPWDTEEYTVENQISSGLHDDLAQRMSEEATVLLRNEPVGDGPAALPLSGAPADLDDVVVVGDLADEQILGDYSPTSTEPDNTPLLEIRRTVAELGGDADDVTYVGADGTLDDAELAAVAAADAVVVVVGTREDDSAEGQDRTTLDLPRGQADLARQVGEANPRTVVSVQSVAQVDLTPFADVVPAILWSTYNGQNQGSALARVLWSVDGVEPSGRLPFTWYASADQLPDIKDYAVAPADGSHGRTYQYFTGDVAYPFGHGLSYTDLEVTGLTVSRPQVAADGTIEARATVRNTGDRAGSTVVQLYATAPRADGVTRPQQRLAGFEKVSLGAGESRTVRFPVAPAELWSWDDDRETVDRGRWTLTAGQSAADPSATARFTVSGQRARTLQQVTAVPSGSVIDLDDPEPVEAGVSAVANDQSFYDLDDVRVRYRSSAPEVATVDRHGTVRGLATGVATITAAVMVDGTTRSTSFPVAVAPDTPELTALTLDGEPVPGFDPDVTAYTVRLGADQPFPVVAALSDGRAEVSVEQATPGAPVATVRAAYPGQTPVTTTVRFVRPLESTDFRGATADDVAAAGWQVLRPDGKLEHTADGVRIPIGDGDLYASNDDAKNLLVHDAPDEWQATVRFGLSEQLAEDWEKAVVGVRDDDSNFVLFDVQWDEKKRGIEVSLERDGARQQEGRVWPVPGTDDLGTELWFRLTRTGDTYRAAYSTDGTTFVDVGGSLVLEAENPQLMLAGYGKRSGASARSVTFREVTVTDVP
ncbi:glycoside hydrolase family 3 N-terminal domain-containing protein [Isoptericola sp. NPDC019482]|uniref:glycoside hydrolase family 3 N-terminal domain-containing protein n=1 Tax=Isoptericola sp. NPDC019482 TaxID=3154688 RepID=UPI003489B271